MHRRRPGRDGCRRDGVAVSSGIDLPRVDVQGFRTAASPEKVIAALAPTLLKTFGSRRARLLARILKCRERVPSRPFALDPGAELAGFRIESVDETRVVISGEHRFASYELVFECGCMIGVTSVNAETRAWFPGVQGFVYKMLVVGSGAHRRVVKRILKGLKTRAEVAHHAL